MDAILLQKIRDAILNVPGDTTPGSLNSAIYLQQIRNAILEVNGLTEGSLNESIYLQQIRNAILGVPDGQFGSLNSVVYLQQIRDAFLGVPSAPVPGSLDEGIYLNEIIDPGIIEWFSALGPELITNGNMADGNPPTGWEPGGDTPILSRVVDGEGFALDDTITAGGGGGVIQINLPMVVGRTYRLSSRLRNVNLSNSGIRILIFDNAFNIVISGDWITSTEWTVSTFDFTLATPAGHVYFQVSGLAGQHGRATDISLREVLHP